MRVSLVSANRQALPDPVIPLGLLYVMEALPPHCEPRLVDLLFETDPLTALRAHLADFAPHLVAVGLRNLQRNDYMGIDENLAWYREVVHTLRQVTDAPVVLGGAGFSVMPAELMETLRPDYGIAGEGETALAALVGTIEQGEDPPPGVYHFREGRLQHPARPTAFLDLDTLAPPRREHVSPRYYETSGIDSVQTKRGCPLGCTYCTYPRIEGRRFRLRSPERVVDELEAALATPPAPSHFFIVDSLFNLPRAHAVAVCEALIRRGWSTPWTAYAHPAGFDPELAALMRRAGCTGVEIGSDSGSDRVLSRLRKGFTTEQILHAHQVCVDAGILDCHTFILGTPGEDLADVEQTLDLLDALDPAAAILTVWVDEVASPDPAQLEARRQLREATDALLVQRAGPRWVVQHLALNYDPRMFRILRRAGCTGPLWQYLDRSRWRA